MNKVQTICDSSLATFTMSTNKGEAKVVIKQPQPTQHSRNIEVEGLEESIAIEETCYAEFNCLLVEVTFTEGNNESYYTPIPIYNNDTKTNLNECLLAIVGGKDSFESYCKKYNIFPTVHGDILKRAYKAYIKE